MNIWPFSKPKKKLRIQLRIGGKLMWDIDEDELRATVKYNGGEHVDCVRTAFANQPVELLVTEYQPPR